MKKRKDMKKKDWDTIKMLLEKNIVKKAIVAITGFSEGSIYRVKCESSWEDHCIWKQKQREYLINKAKAVQTDLPSVNPSVDNPSRSTNELLAQILAELIVIRQVAEKKKFLF